MYELLKYKTADKSPSFYKPKLTKVYVSSYSVGGSSASMPGSTRFGAGGRGKLTLIRPVNSKTSLFRKLATTGARLIEVKLIGKASTTHNHQWCVYSLTGTKITQSGTTSDPLPVEEITLNYEEIKWTYNNTANSRSESFNLAYVEIKWDYPSSGR